MLGLPLTSQERLPDSRDSAPASCLQLLNATNNGFYQREFCWPASAAATWKTKADYRVGGWE
jgi:hypothetical protein